MKTRTRNLLVLLGLALVGGAGFWLAGGGARPSALDAVPARSFLVATVDLEALRASPLGKELGQLGESGMAEVKQRCGFDPLERAKEVAIAVPEDEAPGEFGVVARGDLEARDVAACASALAEARGGKARVVVSDGFTVVEDESGGRAVSRIAMRPGGPLVVGAGRWLDAILEVVRTGRGSARGDAAHASLRAAVAAGAPAVVVTAILPRKLRERIRREVEAEPAEGEREKESAAAMAGVLGVSQVALAFSPGEKGGKATLVAELRCEAEGQCEAVEKLALRKRKAAAADVRLRLAGVSALLEEIEIERRGATLHAKLSHDAEDFASTAARLWSGAVESGAQRSGAPRPQGVDAGAGGP